MAGKLKALGNHIIAAPVIPRKVSGGGIHLVSELAHGDYREFRVISIGPGRRKPDGSFEPILLLPGFRIVSPNANGIQFEYEGVMFYRIHMSEVVAAFPP